MGVARGQSPRASAAVRAARSHDSNAPVQALKYYETCIPHAAPQRAALALALAPELAPGTAAKAVVDGTHTQCPLAASLVPGRMEGSSGSGTCPWPMSDVT